MLDEAQFFVGGFIKGAVCRGSISLTVYCHYDGFEGCDP